MLDRRFPHLSRREFSALAGAAGAVAGDADLGICRGRKIPRPIIKGKKAGLIVHNAKLGVMETPLTELRKYAITPKDILFNRFHYPHEGNAAWYATTAAPSAEMVKNWNIRVDGLVQRPRDVVHRRPAEDAAGKARRRCCNAPATAAPSTPPSRKSAAASGTMAAWAMSNGKACRCGRSSTA